MLLLLFALSHSLPILLAQPTATLSLEEAIDLGLQNSKALKLSDSKRALLKIKVGQLKNALIPGIQLSSGYSRLSNNITPFTVEMAPGVYKTFNPQILNQYTNRASLNYPVFTGFKLVNSLDNIRFLEQAGELDYEKDRNEIRHQIIRSYFSLQKLMLGKQSLQESQKAAAKRLEDVRALHKQGVALAIDEMKAELQYENLGLSIEECTTQIDIAFYQLKLLLGIPLITEFRLSTLELPFVQEIHLEDCIQKARSQRAELKASAWREKAAASAIKVTKGNVFPVLAIQGNAYYSNPNPRVFPAEEKFKGIWDAGINLSWNPSVLITNKLQVAEAKNNLTQIKQQQDQLQDAIQNELYAAWEQYQLALNRISLNKNNLNYCTENVSVLQSKVDLGTQVLSELTDADAALTQAKLNQSISGIDAGLAYDQLLKSMGE